MEYLEGIIKSLLTEEAMASDVIDAIKKRYEVKMTYNDGTSDKKGKGSRIIQPVAYGKTKAGNLVVRAFEPYGDSKRGTPHWKFFRLDRITSWKGMKNVKFSEPPADQWNAEGKFNPEGDGTMSEVFLVADFKGAKERYNANLKNANDRRAAQAKEKDPFYKFKQNIANARKRSDAVPDYVKKNVADWQKQQDRINNKGNQASIQDMSRVQNFGDTETQTNGPQYKNSIERPSQPVKQQMNYKEVEKNGPVYKSNMQTQMVKDNEPQIDNDIENNKENAS